MMIDAADRMEDHLLVVPTVAMNDVGISMVLLPLEVRDADQEISVLMDAKGGQAATEIDAEVMPAERCYFSRVTCRTRIMGDSAWRRDLLEDRQQGWSRERRANSLGCREVYRLWARPVLAFDQASRSNHGDRSPQSGA